jgi:hypothetical protein
MCRAPAPRNHRTEAILDRAIDLNTSFTNALGGPANVTPWEASCINRAVELVLVAEADLHASADASLHAFQSVERAQVAIDGLRLTGSASRVFDRLAA